MQCVFYKSCENCTKRVHKKKEKCTIIVQINDFYGKHIEKCTSLVRKNLFLQFHDSSLYRIDDSLEFF